MVCFFIFCGIDFFGFRIFMSEILLYLENIFVIFLIDGFFIGKLIIIMERDGVVLF